MRKLPASVLALTAGLAFSSCTSPASDGDSAPPTLPPSASPSSPKPDSDETPPAPTRPARVEIDVALTGDFLIHSNVWAAAQTSKGFDFYPLIKPVAPIIKKADLAICHLETPLSPKGGPYESYPLFAAPPALLDSIVKAGYDGCTTASNHTVDQGFEGLTRTLGFLDKAGLKHTGSYKKKSSPRIAYYTVNDLKIASLSYTYGTNGMPVEYPWSVNLIDVQRILADAQKAKAEGADAVLVGLHWGNEYQTEPDSVQLDLADKLTRSKAITLVYGHHAHVVQPIRKINGKWVVFGLGNFLAGQNNYAPGVNDGVIAQVKIVRDSNGRVRAAKPRYVRTRIGPDFVVRKAD